MTIIQLLEVTLAKKAAIVAYAAAMGNLFGH